MADEEPQPPVQSAAHGQVDSGDSSLEGKVGCLILLIFALWWIWYFFISGEDEYLENPPTTPTAVERVDSSSCVKPVNPYGESSGQYAGYVWWAEWNSCEGISEAFVEGCQTYQKLMSLYSDCMKS